MKIKLNKAIIVQDRNIEEIDLSKEKFTAGVILDSEKEFLMTGGVYPQTGMEDSKEYLILIAAKMNKISFESLRDGITGEELLNITKVVRGFFGASALEELIAKVSEKL